MAKPTLESLPTELLNLILFQIPDRASLKSIVLSSPTLHQAYLSVRQQVLTCILKKQYGLLLGEAILVIRSRGLFFASHKEEAIALLDTWRRSKEISELDLTGPRIDKPSNMEEILGLFQFEKLLQFFLEDYTTKPPQPEWIEHDQWAKMLPIDLSDDERHRFLRALCRLQAHSNIFAPPEVGPYIGRSLTDFDNNWAPLDRMFAAEEEVYRLFYGTLPPWEYDEMGCVWAYLKTKFPPVYKVVSDGLRDLVAKHGSADPWFHDYFEDLDLPSNLHPPWHHINSTRELEDLPDRTSALAALGPSFLYRLLHAEPLLQRDMVLSNAADYGNTFIGIDMYVDKDRMLPLIYPADRHAVKDFDQFWSTLPPLERPNLAWKNVFVLTHTPEDNLEDVIDLAGERETGWDWGLAIWDDERLKRWEAPELQLQQRTPFYNVY